MGNGEWNCNGAILNEILDGMTEVETPISMVIGISVKIAILIRTVAIWEWALERNRFGIGELSCFEQLFHHYGQRCCELGEYSSGSELAISDSIGWAIWWSWNLVNIGFVLDRVKLVSFPVICSRLLLGHLGVLIVSMMPA